MEISMKDFMKIEIVIAKILEIEKLPNTEKLFKVKVDAGNREPLVIAGGAEFYDTKDLIGKKVVLLSNLEPKEIRGVRSEGMLLAADWNGKPFWLTVEEEVPTGTRVK
jgi:methionine--tRNA ligase beta chain